MEANSGPSPGRCCGLGLECPSPSWALLPPGCSSPGLVFGGPAQAWLRAPSRAGGPGAEGGFRFGGRRARTLAATQLPGSAKAHNTVGDRGQTADPFPSLRRGASDARLAGGGSGQRPPGKLLRPPESGAMDRNSPGLALALLGRRAPRRPTTRAPPVLAAALTPRRSRALCGSAVNIAQPTAGPAGSASGPPEPAPPPLHGNH